MTEIGKLQRGLPVRSSRNSDSTATVLITGGAGFIGGHLAERLVSDGHRVISMDDLSTGHADNLTHLKEHPRFEFVQGSVLDDSLVEQLASRADVIFHLAAAVGVQHILDNSLDSLRTNVRGTEVVLENATRHRIPTLVASTSEVYGKSPASVLHEDEDRVVGSPLVKRWSYAEAKALDETLAHLLWREQKVPTVIVRLFNVAGPRQTGRYGMVLPRFVDQALRGEPLTVYGDGSQTRSFCHVSDVVEGLIALISEPAAYGEVFNLGRPEEVSIKELAERVIAMTGSTSEIKYVSYLEAYGDGYEDTMRRVPDISRARSIVGFEPKRSLDDIIRSVIDQHTGEVRGPIGEGHAALSTAAVDAGAQNVR